MRPFRSRHLVLLLLVLFCLATLIACSSSKGVRKSAQSTSPFDNSLMASGQDEVMKKLGEPTVISRTFEGHILWVYRPSWKLLPDDKGTLYVEFEDGKVAKIFKKK